MRGFMRSPCHNRRIHCHKVFDDLTARGKTSMGWFYGLKLHLVINHKGQIMALTITLGNTADSTVFEEITPRLTGKGYTARAISATRCSASSGGAACISSSASGATCATI